MKTCVIRSQGRDVNGYNNRSWCCANPHEVP